MQQDTGPEQPHSGEPHRSEPRGTSSDTGTGLEPNVAGALCYLLGLITGVLFLVLEKDKPVVRFHAFQSIGVSVAWVALSIVTSIIGVVPFIGWIVGALMGLVLALAGLILWVYLMYTAFSGKQVELPFVGPWAREQAGL
jgi:uncharacterized membrane protein